MKVRDLLIGNQISCELYPDAAKLKKQMSYADARKIPYIIMAGEEEIKTGVVTVKIMSSGEQRKISPEALPGLIVQM